MAKAKVKKPVDPMKEDPYAADVTSGIGGSVVKEDPIPPPPPPPPPPAPKPPVVKKAMGGKIGRGCGAAMRGGGAVMRKGKMY